MRLADESLARKKREKRFIPIYFWPAFSFTLNNSCGCDTLRGVAKGKVCES